MAVGIIIHVHLATWLHAAVKTCQHFLLTSDTTYLQDLNRQENGPNKVAGVSQQRQSLIHMGMPQMMTPPGQLRAQTLQ